jgi:hypothetical protein
MKNAIQHNWMAFFTCETTYCFVNVGASESPSQTPPDTEYVPVMLVGEAELFSKTCW